MARLCPSPPPYPVSEPSAPITSCSSISGIAPHSIPEGGGMRPGISIGHPVGASGARLATSLVNLLEQTGGRYGLRGLGNAMILERV
ncbi:MAG: hypothetical protein J0H98_01410 [Solirubrobacterales bacterium]|nr:hypothetical protein [Solirubrobacterales bacterium]